MAIEDVLVLAAALLLPWAYGGVRIWAYRSAAFLLAAAAAAALARNGPAGLGLDRRARWLTPAFLLAGFALLQIVPLPFSIVRVVSPRAHEIYRETFPGYGEGAPRDAVAAIEEDALRRVPESAAVAPPDDRGERFEPTLRGRWSGRRPLSLHPDATVERLFWYVALLLAFLVVRARAADRDVRRVYRAALFGLFAALATFALVQKLTWNGRIYWIGPKLEDTIPFGPNINYDHFAGVMELATPWLAAFAWERFRARGRGAARDRTALLAAGGASVCLAAGLLAASKTAAVLLPLGLSALALWTAQGVRRRILVSGGLAALWSAVALVLAITPLGGRVRYLLEVLGRGLSSFDRIVGWRCALGMLRDFPLTGAGFGAFRQVFPRYLPAGESDLWLQLHNDYLEVLVDGGIVAGLLVAWLAWGFWSRALSSLSRDGGARRRLARVGLVLGLLSLSVHALVDFNHQIPANALLFVVASALALREGAAPGDDGR